MSFKNQSKKATVNSAGQGANELKVLTAPVPTSVWAHTSGRLYTVLMVTSPPDEEKTADFPVSVLYLGSDGRKWVKSLKRWHDSMTPVSGPDFKAGSLMSFVSVALLLWRASRASRK